MKKPEYKILSLDGGGIRGVIPCIILKFIEEQTGRNTSELFHLIAGTSTGGIIALGLTTPDEEGNNKYNAEMMLGLYKDNGKKIFEKRDKDFISFITGVGKIKDLTQNPYLTKNIESLLDEYFGKTKLSEAMSDVLITTYDLECSKPFYYSSRLAKTTEKENFKMAQIARSTSAAPTYFTPMLTKYDEKQDVAFIDGGVFANNPSVLAYAEAKELWKQRQEKSKGFDAIVTKDDHDFPFFLLSLGTGYHPTSISGKDAAKFRAASWIEPLLQNIFMNSVAASSDYVIQHLLPPYTDDTPRYKRFNVLINEENTQMDDASQKNIDALIASATAYINKNEKALLDICDLIS